ncbi:MAG: hypothetical protein WCK81_00845 [Betaproteobacteria bacterium]
MSTLLEAFFSSSYTGHFSSLVFLGLCGVLTLPPGLIHHFKHDGGAESIAGLNLGDQRELVIEVFGWLGATQISWGLLMLAVSLHYQMLAPLLLLLIVLERSLLVWRWWGRNAGAGHRPPEHYASLVLLPFGMLFLLLALTSNA